MLKLEKILLTILFVGSCLALLMPFVMAPVLYTFVFDKIIFFQIIIELLIPIWVVLILINSKYRPQLNFLTSAILIFFSALFLAALFGIDFSKSFWGYDERMNGIFTLLHFLAFYLILSSFFKKEFYRKFILFFSLGVSFLMSLLAFLEHFYKPFEVFLGSGGRAASLTGNPIFLASYLLFHFFLALFIFAKKTDWRGRIIFGGISFVNLMALFLTETRGALLALFFGIFIIFAKYIFFSENKKSKIIAIVLFLFLITFFIFTNLYKDNALIKSIPGFNRLNQISTEGLISGTGETRLLIWNVAINGWKERSFFGWGPENFDIVYDKFYNPQSLNYSWYETWGDKAHNLPLEILATSGLIGFISYLLIFVAIFSSIFKIKDKHRIILSGLFAAYFFQNLFAFDSSCSLLMFFLLMAYVSSRMPEKALKIKPASYKQALIVGCFCLVASFFSVIFLNIRPALASNYARKSIGVFYQNPLFGKEYFEKSIFIWSPYHDSARIKFANAVYLSEDKTKDMILLAIREIEKSVVNHPQDFSYPLTLGNLYTSIGKYNLAFQEYEKALKLSPKRQIVYFQYASAKFLAEDDDGARGLLRQAVDLNKNVREPYWRLGLGLLGKDDKEAIKMAKKAIEIGYCPLSMEEINAFASVFIRDANWEELVLYYELLVKYNTESADIFAQLAVAYLEAGEKEKAREAALKAAEIDPCFKEETEMFIKLLE